MNRDALWGLAGFLIAVMAFGGAWNGIEHAVGHQLYMGLWALPTVFAIGGLGLLLGRAAS